MEMKLKMIAMIFLLINYCYYYYIACGCCCPRDDRQCHHVAQLPFASPFSFLPTGTPCGTLSLQLRSAS